MKKKVVIGTSGLVLISIVVIAVHLVALGAVADTENGRSPFTALPLSDGKNTGTLAPGESRWYQFIRTSYGSASQQQMNLTLIFTPDDGQRVHRVNFQIFPADQITRWYEGDVSQMQNVGAGGIVSRDGNPVTGELLWSGWVLDNNTYYIQVFNSAEVTIDYWLFPADVIHAELGAVATPPPAVNVPAGADPNHPMTLPPGLQKGHLAAGQELWYSLIYDDYDGQANEEHTFTFVFTPDDGQRVHRVNFEIFSASQLQIWQRGDTDKLNNVGAGSIVSRDGDPVTGELFWTGWLMDGEAYLLKIYNSADADVDFWLFPEDVPHPELGGPTPTPVPVNVPPGTDPFHTLTLDVGINTGKLAPGQERWYSFVRDDYDNVIDEHAAFTMMFTPDDGHRIHRVNFELFTADQLHIWARGDTDRLHNFGAGGIVSRDGNPVTGELLWSGWLMDGSAYYMKIHNDSDVTIDYWLFPGDIVRAELGAPTPPPPPSDVPAGVDPNHPLPLAIGLNKDSLNPGQERWYSIVRGYLSEQDFKQLTLSLFFTPDDGNRVHHVNFELFTANQLHIWQRGDTDQLHNFGAGSAVSRDGDPNTGELLWSGWLMSGESYLLKISNNADVAIDYWLFTADVLHPELGTLSAP
jgi:hypothetical protein